MVVDMVHEVRGSASALLRSSCSVPTKVRPVAIPGKKDARDHLPIARRAVLGGMALSPNTTQPSTSPGSLGHPGKPYARTSLLSWERPRHSFPTRGLISPVLDIVGKHK